MFVMLISQKPTVDEKSFYIIFQALGNRNNIPKRLLSQTLMALNSELDSKLRELTFSSSQDHLNIILSQLNSNYMDMYNPFGARDSLEIKSMLYALLTSQDCIAVNNINQRLASKADDLVGSPDRSLQLIGGTLPLILVLISAAMFASSGVVGVSIAIASIAALLGLGTAYLGRRQGASVTLLELSKLESNNNFDGKYNS